ncbi:hypothetical protein ACP70R_043669 [Stipagrostis hirtigluma subsp. patula]
MAASSALALLLLLALIGQVLQHEQETSFTNAVIRSLKAKGIAVEAATTEYVLEAAYVSPNPRVTKMNSDIVKKLNDLAKHRVQWLEVGADGGPPEEIKFALRNISNLKKQILRLQDAVRASGGRFVPLPHEFAIIPEP